ncbi:cyclic diguanylate phosphodiesterase [Betaproteobacteria bacterium]|nr:cyclic diguanylate phosphodiesterase [Betaproteobacteria bacterium]
MPTPYFFFRPVLTSRRSWLALDWQPESPAETDFASFVQCFVDSAAAPLAHVLPLISPISAEFVLQDRFLEAFKGESVTFVLPESCLANEAVIERCKELRAHARPLALQIESPEALRRIPRAVFCAVRFDAAFARQDLSAQDIDLLDDIDLKKIATRVNSHQMFEWLTRRGVQWSDGHFLTTPNPQLGKAPDLTRLKLLRLLSLIKQDDDTREIEAIFREEAQLSYNLLRLVNSVAISVRLKINSLSHAIALLGRHQLQRWLQLLIYANNLTNSNAPSPLMQLAAARGRQMELLSAAIDPIPDVPELTDSAFMTGLFSLLEVLINLPMSEILKELPLQDTIIDALSNPAGGGVLGKLLSAIIASEAGDFASAARLLSDLGISPADHAKSQVTAFYWASRINVDDRD